jgi:hypothetical protein
MPRTLQQDHDEIANLTTGLSRKLWQKPMILHGTAGAA